MSRVLSKEFDRLLQATAEQALSMATTRLASMQIPVTTVREYVINRRDGNVVGLDTRTAIRPDFSMVVTHLSRGISAAGEVRALFDHVRNHKRLAAALLADAAGKELADERLAHQQLVARLIGPVLLTCLESPSPREMLPEAVRAVASDLEVYARSSEFPVRFWAPLIDLKSDLDDVQIGTNLRLRRLDDQEAGHLMSGRQNFFEWMHGFRTTHALETTRSVAKFGASDTGPATDTIRDAVTAMRLLKGGTVGAPLTVHTELQPNVFFRSRGSSSSGTFAGIGLPYEITQEDIAPLSQIIGYLKKVKLSSALITAFRRFNVAMERDRYEDRLIDLWVGLEALFFPDQEQELRFRASLRIAYFLGLDGDSRKALFDGMRQSYDARSWIVHGESQPKKPKDQKWKPATIREISDQTEDALRAVLRLAVLNPGEPRVGEVDGAAVRGVNYRTSMKELGS